MIVRVAVALLTSFSTASHMNLAKSTDACLESVAMVPAVSVISDGTSTASLGSASRPRSKRIGHD